MVWHNDNPNFLSLPIFASTCELCFHNIKFFCVSIFIGDDHTHALATYDLICVEIQRFNFVTFKSNLNPTYGCFSHLHLHDINLHHHIMILICEHFVSLYFFDSFMMKLLL